MKEPCLEIDEKIRAKFEYGESLKNTLHEISKLHKFHTVGIYERIHEMLPISQYNPEFECILTRTLKELRDSKKQYIDCDFPSNESQLSYLQKMFQIISTGMLWYRISEFLKGKNYEVFGNFCIKDQAFRSRGFSYLHDAFCTLSAQPGLIIRLFNIVQVDSTCLFSVWLNINGVWSAYLIDDNLPIFTNKQGRSQFFMSSPDSQTNEIWYCLLEKAYAKAYGGYHNLFGGHECYALRDLTGAPILTYSICVIDPSQMITDADTPHIEEFWKRTKRSLEKGYLVSLIPRLPSKEEKEQNQLNPNLYNKESLIENGIYSSHNYSVVSVAEVDGPNGHERIIKLRHAWINEIWTGKWSPNWEGWTEDLRTQLSYPKDRSRNGEFWMSFNEAMWYFETLNICKCSPENYYSQIQLHFPKIRIPRMVLRTTVTKRGKWTFSLDQKDRRVFSSQAYTYAPVKLTLIRLEDSGFKLQAHTSTNNLRNCFIRKLIEPGEYIVLVEKGAVDINHQLENDSPSEYADWRDCVLSVYGPATCPLMIVEKDEKHLAHDFLMYESWKWYASERGADPLTTVKMSIADEETVIVQIQHINIPSSSIYVIKHEEDSGLEISTTFKPVDNMEFVGPSGRINEQQRFIVNKDNLDIFILREAENLVNSQPIIDKFQILRIKGQRLDGFLDNKRQRKHFYDYILDHSPKQVKSMIEEYPELAIFGLYNNLMKRISIKQKEVKLRRKSYTIRKRDEITRNRTSYTLPIQGKLQSNTSKPPIEKEEKEFERIVTPKEKMQIPLTSRVEDVNKEQLSQPSSELERNVRSKSNIRFSESREVIGEGRRTDSRRDSVLDKQKPILKNSNKNQNKEKEKLMTTPKPVEINAESRRKFCRMLSLSKEEIFELRSEEILELIKFVGLDHFLALYELESELAQKLLDKLKLKDNTRLKSPPAEKDLEHPNDKEIFGEDDYFLVEEKPTKEIASNPPIKQPPKKDIIIQSPSLSEESLEFPITEERDIDEDIEIKELELDEKKADMIVPVERIKLDHFKAREQHRVSIELAEKHSITKQKIESKEEKKPLERKSYASEEKTSKEKQNLISMSNAIIRKPFVRSRPQNNQNVAIIPKNYTGVFTTRTRPEFDGEGQFRSSLTIKTRDQLDQDIYIKSKKRLRIQPNLLNPELTESFNIAKQAEVREVHSPRNRHENTFVFDEETPKKRIFGSAKRDAKQCEVISPVHPHIEDNQTLSFNQEIGNRFLMTTQPHLNKIIHNEVKFVKNYTDVKPNPPSIMRPLRKVFVDSEDVKERPLHFMSSRRHLQEQESLRSYIEMAPTLKETSDFTKKIYNARMPEAPLGDTLMNSSPITKNFAVNIPTLQSPESPPPSIPEYSTPESSPRIRDLNIRNNPLKKIEGFGRKIKNREVIKRESNRSHIRSPNEEDSILSIKRTKDLDLSISFARRRTSRNLYWNN